MANILISPGKYVQGNGELKRLATYVSPFGNHALALITASGHRRIGADIESGFAGQEATITFEFFNGECSRQEVDRIMAVAKEKGCDVIAGIGGGKTLDTAKAVAHFSNLPVVICPTIASTDAPCSALSVLYTEDGAFDAYLFLPSNPNVVLMDTAVIASSPVRLTVSGMGDALATYFEARAALRKGAVTCAGGAITLAAMGLAKLCFDTLVEEGIKAKLALETGACTKSVEKIIEANTLLSGIGFESGGLAGAHSIHNGLTKLEECHHMYHGEKVAFGTLSQLVLENSPLEEMEQIIDLCIDLGLPVTLGQLGITEISRKKLMIVAEAACAPEDTMGNMPFPVKPDMVCDAMLAADAMGREALGIGQ